MKILITGSNGLLGQKLIKLLCDKDVNIIATSRGVNRLPNDGQYQYESLDIVNRQQVIDVIGKHKPDVIINTAAMTNVDQCESEKEACWDLNVNAVKYLIEACTFTGTHLLHVSTDFIFDGSHGPLTEHEEPNPISYYGESKLAAEKLVIESRIKWSIARTVLVYGIAHDMSRSNIVLWVKNSLEAGKAINVVNDQWRTPTLAEDLAMGCYLIAIQAAEGIYHISGEEMMTPYDIAIKTAAYFQLDKSLINETDGSKFTQPAKRPPKTGFIINKAKSELGYSPKSFEEGLKVLASQLD
ncbi:SDR family oxidoreductase [Fulvivirga lutimaris]|uniref:SDR family oxidoreductase n=1 Tax=Fulvivirga lutimaris TaxID=1819566 RepID=UPI0012BBEBCB|nr:NAD(P)-dependent oxidoreductase [Fulvivirga lutimaris]MTI39872.1 NAD(P)-dependent oxidoreductase [Fulvivirga lutimaris]